MLLNLNPLCQKVPPAHSPECVLFFFYPSFRYCPGEVASTDFLNPLFLFLARLHINNGGT